MPTRDALTFGRRHPVTEVSGEGIEVHAQTVAGEDRNATVGQSVGDLVDEGVSTGLRAVTDLEAENELGRDVERDPDPDFGNTAGLGFEFVELDVAGDDASEEAVMKRRVEGGEAGQPARNRGGMMAKDAGRGGLIDAFTEGGDDLIDTVRGGLKCSHGGMTALRETMAAGLTTQPWDGFMLAANAVADERMEGLIADLEVVAGGIIAVETVGGGRFRTTARGLASRPREDIRRGMRRRRDLTEVTVTRGMGMKGVGTLGWRRRWFWRVERLDKASPEKQQRKQEKQENKIEEEE